MNAPHRKRVSLLMNSRRDFGTSLCRKLGKLKELRAADINKVTLKSDDITESESACAVKRETL